MNRAILIFILASNIGFAQNITISTYTENPVNIPPDYKLIIPQNTNQYLATKWTKGRLFYTNGTSKNFDSLNFDRYANKIEVVSNDKLLTLMPMGILGAVINNSPDNGSVLLVADISGVNTYLVILSMGSKVLGLYLSSDEPEKERGFKTDELRFVPKAKIEVSIDSHYIIYENGTWTKFKLNKSSIAKLFKIDKKQLQEVASQKNIDLSETSDLIKLFDLLNNK